MKNSSRILALLAVAGGLAGAGFWFSGRASTEDANLTLYGNVEIREVELAFRQSGRLTRVHVQEGDRVKQEQLVAELDTKPLRDAYAAAHAEVALAKAELKKLQRGNRRQDILRGEASVAQAQAIYERAHAELERQSRLRSVDATSKKALDTAVSAKAEAAAALQSAQQALSLLKEGARQEDIEAAQARLAAAEAAQALARTAVDDGQLKAPQDGTVLVRVREPGSLLSARDPVVTLSLTDPIYVRAYVAEPQLGLVAPGTKVWVRSDSSSAWHEAQVGFVSPRAEFTPKAVETATLRTDLVYRLRVIVTKVSGSELLQGMPVTVRLKAPQAGRS